MKYLFIIVAALFLLPTTNYQLPTTLAQSPSCPIQSPNPRVDKGLITTLTLSGNFGTPTGACVVDAKAPFAPFKIPTYDDLKSLYYTQSKATKSTIATLSSITDQNVYYRAGDLTVNGLSGTGTAVVFVDGNLTIGSNLSDLAINVVFVVKRNVYIDKSVTQINAVIIAEGLIYTAYDISTSTTCLTNTIQTSSALTINGSLISLNTIDNIPIKFCRTLADNSLPAEKVINQPKYLVILRNILSDTWQKWSEIQ